MEDLNYGSSNCKGEIINHPLSLAIGVHSDESPSKLGETLNLHGQYR